MRFALGIESENYPAYLEALPEGFSLENFFVSLIRDENLTSIQFDHHIEEGFDWEIITLEVADFNALFGGRRRIGPFEIMIVEQEGEFSFSETIDIQKATIAIPGVNLMDLSKATFTVNFQTPQITDTNGLQTAAGLSTWSIPIVEVFQGGSTAFLWADYVLEPYEGVFVPWEMFFPYVMIGFLSLGAISIFTVIFVNTVIKREKKPTLKFK